MKINAFVAAAVFGIGLLSLSFSSAAQVTPPSEDDEEGGFCLTPNDPGCAPVGSELCTEIGCYQMFCNSFGCDLLFKPRNPIRPRHNEP